MKIHIKYYYLLSFAEIGMMGFISIQLIKMPSIFPTFRDLTIKLKA
ncbi:hypothetical protein J537_1844 [Acinetobacter baumannii 1437282]|nr:hypothetical protein J537_1844 [Acinetobacter baumannii 1437282]